ncbi:Xaa-Pro aminopeptidase [bacterium]|nr:Xaa-Pro aminopeptidase [bacterium]
MQAMGHGVAILPSAPVTVRTADLDHEYRQDSDFFYLTGFKEPESVLVLAPNHPEHKTILFVRPRDKERETWDGRRAGTEGALRDYGVDAAYTIDQFDAVIGTYLDNQEHLYFQLGKNKAWDERVLDLLKRYKTRARSGVKGPSTMHDPSEILHEMRLFKSAEEIELMRKSAAIAAEAHTRAMQATRPGVYEYEIQAEIEYTFKRRGAMGPAYGSIVGGGANGCILHYVENDAVLKDGDLLLIDAGAEYGFYASDITRTFPVNGRFSPAQQEVYEVVLEAQLEALATVKPGVTFQAVHDAAVRVLTAGLVRLGILSGEVDALIASEAYKPFYMHKTSHWLGIDTHDVGAYKLQGEWRTLQPGMVLTIEPGLYITEGQEGVDPKYWNIGIRIEDDVLVTPDGHENLTRQVPKSVEEIERLMQTALAGAR